MITFPQSLKYSPIARLYYTAKTSFVNKKKAAKFRPVRIFFNFVGEKLGMKRTGITCASFHTFP